MKRELVKDNTLRYAKNQNVNQKNDTCAEWARQIVIVPSNESRLFRRDTARAPLSLGPMGTRAKTSPLKIMWSRREVLLAWSIQEAILPLSARSSLIMVEYEDWNQCTPELWPCRYRPLTRSSC